MNNAVQCAIEKQKRNIYLHYHWPYHSKPDCKRERERESNSRSLTNLNSIRKARNCFNIATNNFKGEIQLFLQSKNNLLNHICSDVCMCIRNKHVKSIHVCGKERLTDNCTATNPERERWWEYPKKLHSERALLPPDENKYGKITLTPLEL